MKKILCFLSVLLPIWGNAQDEDLRYEDHVYLPNIKTVAIHSDGILLSLPVLYQGGGSVLKMSFDDLSEETKNYTYTVEYCNADWTPSNLSPFEYIDGFQEGDIRDFDYSFKAKTKYTHYSLYLPNQDMKFLASGNYLLKVYEDEDEKRLAITRRFVVAENLVDIEPTMTRPARVDKGQTHQEIDFKITHPSFEVRNPRSELMVTVLQNGRWDNAITGLRPQFTKPFEEVFDYQDKIVFPAGKEFRYLDLRSFRTPYGDVQSVQETETGPVVVMGKEQKRGSMPYFDRRDINGLFVIENMDEEINQNLNSQVAQVAFSQLTAEEERVFNERLNAARSNSERSQIQSERQEIISRRQAAEVDRLDDLFGNPRADTRVSDLLSEYVEVLLQLSSPGEMYDYDLYVFGKMTDWQLKPAFKLAYNPAVNAYVAKLRLKQGYYEYLYAAVPHGSRVPDFEETEGDWHETTNNYTILVYYRPFGGRNDRLIGEYTFGSREWATGKRR